MSYCKNTIHRVKLYSNKSKILPQQDTAINTTRQTFADIFMISDSISASTALFLIPFHLEVLNVNDFVFKTHPELPRVDDGLVGWSKYHVPNLMSRSPMHYAETVATARKQMKRFKAAVDAVDDFSGTVVSSKLQWMRWTTSPGLWSSCMGSILIPTGGDLTR